MTALCWRRRRDVRVETVPDPTILNPHDAIVKITLTAICGSDLHLYDGYIPAMEPGDILGHEFMGEVVEVGPEVDNLRPGDRVVVPFPISCGRCFFCQHQLWSLCVKATTRVMESDRPHVLREAIMACRKGGTVSIPGVYGGLLDKVPFGAAMNKGLTLKTGQTHVHRYLRPLLKRIAGGEIDPSFVITHRLSLDEAPRGYEIFGEHSDGCIKVVLTP